MLVSGVRSSWETVEMKRVLGAVQLLEPLHRLDAAARTRAPASARRPGRGRGRRRSRARAAPTRRGTTDCTQHPARRPRRRRRRAPRRGHGRRAPRRSRRPRRHRAGGPRRRGRPGAARAAGRTRAAVRSTPRAAPRTRWGAGGRRSSGAVQVPCTAEKRSASTSSTSQRSTAVARPTDSAARLTSWPESRSWRSARAQLVDHAGLVRALEQLDLGVAQLAHRLVEICGRPRPDGLRGQPTGALAPELAPQATDLRDRVGRPGGLGDQVHVAACPTGDARTRAFCSTAVEGLGHGSLLGVGVASGVHRSDGCGLVQRTKAALQANRTAAASSGHEAPARGPPLAHRGRCSR